MAGEVNVLVWAVERKDCQSSWQFDWHLLSRILSFFRLLDNVGKNPSDICPNEIMEDIHVGSKGMSYVHHLM